MAVLSLLPFLLAPGCDNNTSTPEESTTPEASAEVPPQQTPPPPPDIDAENPETVARADTLPTSAAVDASGGVILLGIGVHIEPFGARRGGAGGGDASSRDTTNLPPRGKAGKGGKGRSGGGGGGEGRPSKASGKSGGKSGGSGGKGSKDYNDPEFFARHVSQIDEVAKMVESHGGKLTVESEDPFTSACMSSNCTLFSDLVSRGHHVGFHFHEDTHLGNTCEPLPVETWCTEVKRQTADIAALSGLPVRYMSGGGLYPSLLEVAACADIQMLGEWKSRVTHQYSEELMGSHPWRPQGGPSEVTVTPYATHSSSGEVIFLPPGLYTTLTKSDTEEAHFTALKNSLEQTIEAASSDRVNVFYFTIHPGEYGTRDGTFQPLDEFLRDVVDPLVASGTVRWASFEEMGDAYQSWEANNPEMRLKPRGTQAR